MRGQRLPRWSLRPGDETSRTELNEEFGGSGGRGISAPAADSMNSEIMLFHDPERGPAYGYEDGWDDQDVFHFSGMGQLGDQRFDAPGISENRKVRDHAKDGHSLRLLRYTGKNRVMYIGEFALDPEQPFYTFSGIDRRSRLRSIIGFRLLPLGNVFRLPGDVVRKATPFDGTTALEELPGRPTRTQLEQLEARSHRRAIQAADRLVRREELELVHNFAAWATRRDLEVCAYDIPHRPTGASLRADAFVLQPRTLLEAKATVERSAVRMGIGQLLDYRRYFDEPLASALLLPRRPPDDLCALLEELDLGLVYAVDGGFSSERCLMDVRG